jgi:hypothetical protein
MYFSKYDPWYAMINTLIGWAAVIGEPTLDDIASSTSHPAQAGA